MLRALMIGPLEQLKRSTPEHKRTAVDAGMGHVMNNTDRSPVDAGHGAGRGLQKVADLVKARLCCPGTVQ